MSRKYGEREGRDAGPSSAPSVAPPTPGKSSRTEGIVATGKGEGDGLGAEKGPAITGPAGGAVPAKTGTVKVTHETDQDTPSGAAKTRTTVGVGELVYFTAESADKGSSWSATAGKGKANDANYDWRAPATPSSVTITFDPGGGGTATTVEMKVIGPNGITYSDKKEDSAPTGMTNKLTFLPLSVCFWGTQWREQDVDAANIKGFFTHIKADKLKHHAASPKDIGSDNSGPKDHASFAATKPFGEAGSFSWEIPQQYSVKGANNWQQIVSPFTQLTSIEVDGTVTVTKNGESVTK
jgi:hypothetical protein